MKRNRTATFGGSMRTQKLDIPNQVKDLTEQGFLVNDIQFAQQYLKEHLNYYRLKAYIPLLSQSPLQDQLASKPTFEQLVELSRLDLSLRRIILPMTIDIEFALKLKLNCDCSENDADDGYDVVEAYIKQNPNLDKRLKDSSTKPSSNYGNGIIQRHYPDFAVWNILEIFSFGEFTDFWDYYYKHFPSTSFQYQLRYNQLYATRQLRNACAHNNFILPSILKKPLKTNKQLMSAMPNIMKSKEIEFSHKELQTIKNSQLIGDLSLMLWLYSDCVVSKSLRKNAAENLYELIHERSVNSKRLLSDYPLLLDFHKVFSKIFKAFF